MMAAEALGAGLHVCRTWLEVFEGWPPMLDDATIFAIRRAGLRDIDDPPAGWLADLAPVLK
jgi:hypothetical protein